MVGIIGIASEFDIGVNPLVGNVGPFCLAFVDDEDETVLIEDSHVVVNQTIVAIESVRKRH
uniref:hypothetical protein n=1 Tax=Halococcus sediminicola TaxID=1264579 RepID=UPI000678EC8C|nr:hypothetical protein [Halococcus sediminicola]